MESRAIAFCSLRSCAPAYPPKDFAALLNLPSDLLGLTSFEQYEDVHTDTVIYSFNKIIRLLLECNPNTIEMLGLDEEQYLIRVL